MDLWNKTSSSLVYTQWNKQWNIRTAIEDSKNRLLAHFASEFLAHCTLSWSLPLTIKVVKSNNHLTRQDEQLVWSVDPSTYKPVTFSSWWHENDARTPTWRRSHYSFFVNELKWKWTVQLTWCVIVICIYNEIIMHTQIKLIQIIWNESFWQVGLQIEGVFDR